MHESVKAAVCNSINMAKKMQMLFVAGLKFKHIALLISTMAELRNSAAWKLSLIYMHGCCCLLWIGLFKSAAVQSDRCQEFKFVPFQTVQIVLESQNRGNIGSVLPLWIKACYECVCPPKGGREEGVVSSWQDARLHKHLAETEDGAVVRPYIKAFLTSTSAV